jgi:hypothetical protein
MTKLEKLKVFVLDNDIEIRLLCKVLSSLPLIDEINIRLNLLVLDSLSVQLLFSTIDKMKNLK